MRLSKTGGRIVPWIAPWIRAFLACGRPMVRPPVS
jgi:hypothetical protein